MVALFVALMFIGFLLVDLIVQWLRTRQSAVRHGPSLEGSRGLVPI